MVVFGRTNVLLKTFEFLLSVYHIIERCPILGLLYVKWLVLDKLVDEVLLRTTIVKEMRVQFLSLAVNHGVALPLATKVYRNAHLLSFLTWLDRASATSSAHFRRIATVLDD